MEDDFDLPEKAEEEQTIATATTPQQNRGRLEPQDQTCGVTGCPELRKPKTRFCCGHDRHLCNMRYQATQQGPAQLVAFNKMMANLLIAAEEIRKFAVANAAVPARL